MRAADKRIFAVVYKTAYAVIVFPRGRKGSCPLPTLGLAVAVRRHAKTTLEQRNKMRIIAEPA